MTDETKRPEDSIWARPSQRKAQSDQPPTEQSGPTAEAANVTPEHAEAGADQPAGSGRQLTTEDPATAPTPEASMAPEPSADQMPADNVAEEPAAVAAAASLPFAIPQPPVWEPTDADLDPGSEAGWNRAADHELVAVRPENVPAILAVASAGVLDPATARDVVSGKPIDEAIAAQGLGGEAGGSEGSLAAADSRSWSAMPGFASPPAGGGHGTLATTPQRARPTEPAATGDIPADATLASVAADAAGSAVPAEAESNVVPGSAPASNVIAFPQAGAETALAPSERRWRRTSRRVRSGLESAARPFLVIALFVLGTSIGWTSYLASRPVPAPAAPAQAVDSAASDNVPPQVQSLVAALNSGDQSQVQTVVPADAYRLLAGELASNNVQSIRAAKAQSTYSAGQDSATEILIAATTLDGQNFTFNLVVHLHNGVITEFR